MGDLQNSLNSLNPLNLGDKCGRKLINDSQLIQPFPKNRVKSKVSGDTLGAPGCCALSLAGKLTSCCGGRPWTALAPQITVVLFLQHQVSGIKYCKCCVGRIKGEVLKWS